MFCEEHRKQGRPKAKQVENRIYAEALVVHFPQSNKKKRLVRALTFQRDGFRCLRCGSTENLTYDHVFPKSEGGLRTVSNGQTLCAPCNVAKANKRIDYRPKDDDTTESRMAGKIPPAGE